ncbi:unnamed protein product (macronuclear) [Paramecium tetraurelia]|uniref:Uncharacterized protein n=1 Tax=Paramecium tetraurelia TaxID=5888 RepID=A0E3X7_PARTE|nr:uncharacterized protein GSPATT00023167001 [Paramecium tetraurelia]CAK89994.1 unnamed protein product [Paramecium tetraurelia]|eukprot:XP_001457391.1 hypothetical protein (macronuclear) [Paramecium tetraurelia strain d4-2]
MSEQMLLRAAFVDFLKQMLPLIIDPLLIVNSHFKNFTLLLEDQTKTSQQILEFIEKLKFQPKTENKVAQQAIITEPVSNPQDPKVLTIPLNQVQGTSQNRGYHRRYLSHQTDIYSRIKKDNLQDKQPIQEEIQPKPAAIEKIQVQCTIFVFIQEPGKFTCQFQKFLQIQDNDGFSIVSKECILDDLELAMKEFRRNTKTLLCMAERSSEVNTSESTEVDKTLKHKDYNFSKYLETAVEHQENKTAENTLRRGNNFNILQKYKTVIKNN